MIMLALLQPYSRIGKLISFLPIFSSYELSHDLIGTLKTSGWKA